MDLPEMIRHEELPAAIIKASPGHRMAGIDGPGYCSLRMATIETSMEHDHGTVEAR